MSSNKEVNFTELILSSGNYDTELNDTRRVEYIGALVNGEDVIYLSQEQSLPGSINSTIFLGCVLILALLCTVFAAGNIFYVFKKKKYLESPVYPILVHTFLFTLLLVMVICVEAFTSVITEKSDMHLKRNKLTCFLTNFIKFSIESCSIFQLVLIWLILMSERNLTGLQWLYNDYSLRKALQASDPETASGGSSSTTTTDSSSILALRTRSFGNFIRLRGRQLILYSFYVISFGGAIIIGSQSMVVMFMKSHIVCLPILNHSPVAEMVRFLIILSLPFFFIPALYLFLLWPTVFGKFFGGARDPLLAQLKEEDLRRLKYVRVISFLKGTDAIFAFVHSSSSLYLKGSTVELFRIIALLMMLLELVLFTHYEQAFKTIQSSITSGDGGGGQNISGGFSIPSVARELTTNTGERVRNLIFKKSGDNDDTVDYKQLVENEDN